MDIKITKGYLRKLISEEVYKYFEKNKEKLLREADISLKDLQLLLYESLEKNNGA
jgi:hypothetical protein